MISWNAIHKLTDAVLERWVADDRTPSQLRQACVDELGVRAMATQEALRYPTFEAYNEALNEAARRAREQDGGYERVCGNFLHAMHAERKAFYKRVWADKRQATGAPSPT
jgi:hypothetical protein